MAQITLRDYLQETEDAISTGRTDDALQRCRLILDRFPESLEAQRLLGEVYLAQSQLDEAQRAFDWVLTNDPENVIAYCDRALVCERRSDYDTALDCYQQAYELSRGNSQIRQEFNKLSAKANLPGFMFSRAGLARLYMRGDLMTQSILEWEAILGSNVYRLDARAGLMEAYWRDGQYDQVEQMAQQLLQDVPGCIKALLLLAHVISSRDAQQARDLIRRAESLDPDLLTAQELFSDLFASRQAESFLQLLKKAPVTLDPATSSHEQPEQSVSGMEHQPVADANIPIWTSESMPGFEVPATPDPAGSSDLLQQTVPISPAATPLLGEWPSDPQIDVTPRKEALQESAKLPEVNPEPSNVADVEVWEGAQDESSFESSWNMPPSQDGETPAPPAWLNMLTQGERAKMSTPVLPETAAEAQPPASVVPPPEKKTADRVEETQIVPEEKVAAYIEETLPPVVEEEEESFFGPEWLKALGAETMDANGQPSRAMPVVRKEVPAPSRQAPASAPQEPVAAREAMQESPVLEEVAEEAQTDAERQYYASLRDLEESLRSQGFVDMAPNSLAGIARSNNVEQVPKPDEPLYEEKPTHRPAEEDSGLSEALAQLGNLAMQAQKSQPERVEQTIPPQPERQISSTRPLEIDDVPVVAEQSNASVMPDWVSLLEQTVAAPAKRPAAQQDTSHATPHKPGPIFVPEEPPAPTPRREQQAPAAFGPVFEPASIPPTPVGSQSTPLTTPRANPLLENELETTMRRPAVRLQQLQARVAGQREQVGRIRSFEHQTGSNGPVSSRDRLVKGYQHQLAGDFDDAMQEYRLIIKSTPELLSEVVSNLRALLKLSPKYIAGYRVLGDAYMKQGEYLQAMEAYNKALTMAKRAK